MASDDLCGGVSSHWRCRQPFLSTFSAMSHPPYQLLSKVLLGSALLMLLLGLYFLFAMGNALVGGALLAVAVMDVGVAVLFARKSS